MEINKENYDNLRSQKLKRAEIAQVFSIPDWKLKKIIAKEGWGTKQIRYYYNGCFDKINKSSSYWLGFLMADGCVMDDNRIRLYLQKADIEQLEKFKEFVDCEHKISYTTKYPNRVSLEFTSIEIASILKVYNIVPRKTLKAIPPNPEVFGEYFSDYLRGYFDGDGTISESFSNTNSRLATLYTGFAIAKQSYNWLDNALTNIVKVSYKKFEKENMYSITLNTNKSKALLHYMYDNSEYKNRLNRKFDLFYKTVVMDNRLTR
jgi:hypothetical protein